LQPRRDHAQGGVREAESAQGFARALKAAFPQLATGRAVVPNGRARTWRGIRLGQVPTARLARPARWSWPGDPV